MVGATQGAALRHAHAPWGGGEKERDFKKEGETEIEECHGV
jgi:hypothetical protein